MITRMHFVFAAFTILALGLGAFVMQSFLLPLGVALPEAWQLAGTAIGLALAVGLASALTSNLKLRLVLSLLLPALLAAAAWPLVGDLMIWALALWWFALACVGAVLILIIHTLPSPTATPVRTLAEQVSWLSDQLESTARASAEAASLGPEALTPAGRERRMQASELLRVAGQLRAQNDDQQQ
ncbi:MAG TPA: hypothetical protein VLO13_00285 [Halomonas sp.]|nr:hypothetical protein [Halomonas sp.]